MKDTPPEHLGDGAYATIKDDYLILCANHHDPALASDSIYLEPIVVRALINYIRRNNVNLIPEMLP